MNQSLYAHMNNKRKKKKKIKSYVYKLIHIYIYLNTLYSSTMNKNVLICRSIHCGHKNPDNRHWANLIFFSKILLWKNFKYIENLK
jgi:hypothetical protein